MIARNIDIEVTTDDAIHPGNLNVVAARGGSPPHLRMGILQVSVPFVEARRALVLHDRPLVVGLITLALGHGSFVVRAASRLAEAEAILAEWSPDMSVVDMDHDDSAALLKLLGASNTLERSGTPVLGLTRRDSLKSKLRAFDLGVDDILTMPFSPEELLARAIVIGQARLVAPLYAASTS